MQEKNFICHTKIKIVTKKGKLKLLKQYNTNHLNEIPVPEIPNSIQNDTIGLKDTTFHRRNSAEFAVRAKEVRNRRRNVKNKRSRNNSDIYNQHQSDDGGKRLNSSPLNNVINANNNVTSAMHGGYDEYTAYKLANRRRKKNKDNGRNKAMKERIKWNTYFKNITLSPLHPKPIVEEFTYEKEA